MNPDGHLWRDIADKFPTFTADSMLDMSTMYSIARTLQQAGPRITYVTVPTRPYAKDPHRLEWKQSAADQLFARLKAG